MQIKREEDKKGDAVVSSSKDEHTYQYILDRVERRGMDFIVVVTTSKSISLCTLVCHALFHLQ